MKTRRIQVLVDIDLGDEDGLCPLDTEEDFLYRVGEFRSWLQEQIQRYNAVNDVKYLGEVLDKPVKP